VLAFGRSWANQDALVLFGMVSVSFGLVVVTSCRVRLPSSSVSVVLWVHVVVVRLKDDDQVDGYSGMFVQPKPSAVDLLL
jgi:hypothetical protein